jgi:hypothetical protein
MFDIETISKQFREAGSMAADKKVIVKATFTQSNSSDGPHVAGDIVKVYLNKFEEGEEIGKITFTFDDGEPKSKSLELDITDMLSPEVNFLKLVTMADKNFGGDDSSSECEFSLRVKGKRKINNKYKTDLPLRVIEDSWLLPRISG